jgi:hypothetical protein
MYSLKKSSLQPLRNCKTGKDCGGSNNYPFHITTPVFAWREQSKPQKSKIRLDLWQAFPEYKRVTIFAQLFGPKL